MVVNKQNKFATKILFEGVKMKNLLTQNDLANLLGYSERTINTYVTLGKIPKPKKIFGKRVWEKETILKWLERKGIHINNEGV